MKPLKQSILCLFSLVFTCGLIAQQPGAANPAPMNSAQQRITSIQSQLEQIQTEALESNPELAEQRDELQALIKTTMVENGATPDANIARLQEIQSQVQSGQLSTQEQQSLMQEFQTIRTNLARQQQQAMQDEDVMAEQQAFSDSLMTAMNEVNPETSSLIAQLQQIRQDIMSQRMQQQQGMPQSEQQIQ